MTNIVVKRSGGSNPKIVVQQGSPGYATITVNKGGGAGIEGAVTNGVAYGTSATTLGYATGTYGQILQINETGIPVFAQIDAGEY